MDAHTAEGVTSRTLGVAVRYPASDKNRREVYGVGMRQIGAIRRRFFSGLSVARARDFCLQARASRLATAHGPHGWPIGARTWLQSVPAASANASAAARRDGSEPFEHGPEQGRPGIRHGAQTADVDRVWCMRAGAQPL